MSEFKESLDDLFDIAHSEALAMMKNEEDKQFLLLQRSKGRPGCMAGVDKKLFAREQRSLERKQKEDIRKRTHIQTTQQSEVTYDGAESESTSDEPDNIGDVDVETDDLIQVQNGVEEEDSIREKRGRTNWITPRLTAALDAAKVTDGKAMHILTATADALGVDLGDHVINHSYIYRLRKKNREINFESTHEEFLKNIRQARVVTVHWDGKIMEDMFGKRKIDRIAVLASYNYECKFLTAAKIHPSTGENIAKAVRDVLIQ